MMITVLILGICFATVSSQDVEAKYCRCICPNTLAVFNSSSSIEENNERRVFTSSVSPNKCNCIDVILPEIRKEVKGQAQDFCHLCECKYENLNIYVIIAVVTLLLLIQVICVMYLVYSSSLDPFLKKRFIKKYKQIDELDGV